MFKKLDFESIQCSKPNIPQIVHTVEQCSRWFVSAESTAGENDNLNCFKCKCSLEVQNFDVNVIRRGYVRLLVPGLSGTHPYQSGPRCIRYPSRSKGASEFLEGTCPQSCSEEQQRIYDVSLYDTLRVMGNPAQYYFSRPLWLCNRSTSTKVATHERTSGSFLQAK